MIDSSNMRIVVIPGEGVNVNDTKICLGDKIKNVIDKLGEANEVLKDLYTKKDLNDIYLYNNYRIDMGCDEFGRVKNVSTSNPVSLLNGKCPVSLTMEEIQTMYGINDFEVDDLSVNENEKWEQAYSEKLGVTFLFFNNSLQTIDISVDYDDCTCEPVFPIIEENG